MLGRSLGTCDGPLQEAYDAALLDLDGVLYLGPEPVEHAPESVAAARAAGMRVVYVTNNSSRSAAAVAEHLTGLGIGADEADVVTSSQAVARVLAERLPSGAPVLVVGTEALAAEVAEMGLVPVRTADELGPAPDPGSAAVVQGLSPTTTWADLAEAAVAIRRGALWLAGNRDSTLPSPRGALPGNGAFVLALETATGLVPEVIGKPQPALHRTAVERTGARRPLVVGDRLDTDVLGAVTAGADSLLVLTGVTDLDALLEAPEGSRPTYVGHDLRALQEPQPPARRVGELALCGEARAWREGGRLRTEGPATAALRAACALAWS